MTNQPNKWIVKAFRELRKEYGDICNYPACNVTTNLEFAHICNTCLSGRGRGRKERYYDIKKNPHAYTLLCEYHHLQLDNLEKN